MANNDSNSEKEIDNNEKELRKKASRLSVKEGSASSVMEGFGSRYITAYSLSLGATNFQVGLLSSLPGLLGNLVQLPFLYLSRKYSRKKILFFAVLTQALLWLPIIGIGIMYFFFHMSSKSASNLLILIYSLVIIAGTISGPAWNSWMKDIVQENCGEYFGKRNRVTNIVLVVSMLLAGLILNYFGKEYAFKGFLIIFIIAFLGRATSAFIFTRKYEPKFKFEDNYYFSFKQFAEKMLYNNFGRFVILISLVSFATAIAAPFFAVYMLKDLNFSYLQYTFVILSGIFSTIIFMPLWGKFADKYGNVKVLRLTGVLIPLVPFMYILSIFVYNLGNTYYAVFFLMLTEVVSGFSWAGFNLSSANFIYDAVTRQRMAICVSYYNLVNALGTFIGATFAGITISHFNFIFGIKTLFIVFFISGFLRLLFVLFIGPKIKEVRTVKDFSLNEHVRTNVKRMNVLKYLGINPLE